MTKTPPVGYTYPVWHWDYKSWADYVTAHPNGIPWIKVTPIRIPTEKEVKI